MIRKVTIKNFKRFEEVEFTLPGHVVLAGPNNTGKTTVLQAIGAWSLAYQRWRELNDFQRHGGAYTKAPISRLAFSAVPLRTFELLWLNRDYRGTIEISLETSDNVRVTMEFIEDIEQYGPNCGCGRPWCSISGRAHRSEYPARMGSNSGAPHP